MCGPNIWCRAAISKKCIYFLCGLVIEKRWIKKEEEKVNPRGDGLIVKNLFS